MDYCSIEDAFPKIGSEEGTPTAPGCSDSTGSEKARKEERKRAKKCKGPSLAFLDVDPDRPAVVKTPPVPAFNTDNRLSGVREEAFTSKDVPAYLTSMRQPNDAGQVARSEFPDVAGPTSLPTSKVKVPAYFGASIEGFDSSNDVNVIGNDDSYRLYPDFTSAFNHIAGVDKASAKSLAPIPSVVNEWKPLTPAGTRTAFFDELPPPISQDRGQEPVASNHVSKKLDLLFARLDDLESRRGENTQSEILLFVMSGLFVLFSMDIVTRQGGR